MSQTLIIVSVMLDVARKLTGKPVHEQKQAVARVTRLSLLERSPSVVVDEISRLLSEAGITPETVGTSVVELDQIRKRANIDYLREEYRRAKPTHPDTDGAALRVLEDKLKHYGVSHTEIGVTKSAFDNEVLDAERAHGRWLVEKARQSSYPEQFLQTRGYAFTPEDLGSGEEEFAFLRRVEEASRMYCEIRENAFFSSTRAQASQSIWRLMEFLETQGITPERIGASLEVFEQIADRKYTSY